MFAIVAGSGLCGLGALLMGEAYGKAALAKRLRSAPWTPAGDLARMADEAGPAGVPVKVHGRVGCERPLACELGDKPGGPAAVVQREVLGRWLHNDLDSDTFVVSRVRRAEPFFVQLGGGERVYVRGWGRQQPRLRLVHEHVERTGHSVAVAALAGMLRLPVAYEHIHRELVLPVGEDLVAVGRLTRSRGGELVLRDPAGALERGVLSLDDEADVAARLSRDAAWAGVGGCVVAGLGAYIIGSARS